MWSGTESAEVVVIGAGPYGLSTAAHLRHRGVETRVFGFPMSAWRDHMPKGMFLKSTFDASSLSAPQRGSTLGDFYRKSCRELLDEWHPVPCDVFVDYGLNFQRDYVKDVEQRQVRRVAAAPGGFQVFAEGETVRAKAVVVATGHVAYAHVPYELRASAPFVSHSCNHSDLSELSGKAVAVVGAGQSALESAVLLHEAGARVHLIVRGRSILWGKPPVAGERSLYRLAKPGSPLGPGWSLFVLSNKPEMVGRLPAALRLHLVRKVLGPSGGWWLRDRFKSSIDVFLETTVVSTCTVGSKASLALRRASGEMSQLDVDHVIAATGYKVDVDAVEFLDPALRSRVARVNGSAAPRLSSSFESSVAGLHFIGLSAAATFGPLMRFVCGTPFASRSLAAAIAGAR